MINKINKLLPVVNLIVGLTGLAFQTQVLYPYHNDLDKKLNTLDKKINCSTEKTNKPI